MADRILLREKGFPDTRNVYIIVEIFCGRVREEVKGDSWV